MIHMSIDFVVYAAIDGGGRTGVAMACLPLRSDGKVSDGDVLDAIHDAKRSGRYCTGQVTGSVEFQASLIASDFRAMVGEGRAAFGGTPAKLTVVHEGFDLRGANTKQDGLKVIELNQKIQTMKGDPWMEVISQSPSTKAAISNDRLRFFGLYEKGLPHAMDAVRHLIIALRKFEL